MEKILVLVENKETGQLAFLSIRPDTVEALRKQVGNKWEVTVLQGQEAQQDNG